MTWPQAISTVAWYALLAWVFWIVIGCDSGTPRLVPSSLNPDPCVWAGAELLELEAALDELEPGRERWCRSPRELVIEAGRRSGR